MSEYFMAIRGAFLDEKFVRLAVQEGAIPTGQADSRPVPHECDEVSPEVIYKMTQPREICDDTECKIRYTFEWHSENKTCQSNFMCTKVRGELATFSRSK